MYHRDRAHDAVREKEGLMYARGKGAYVGIGVVEEVKEGLVTEGDPIQRIEIQLHLRIPDQTSNQPHTQTLASASKERRTMKALGTKQCLPTPHTNLPSTTNNYPVTYGNPITRTYSSRSFL